MPWSPEAYYRLDQQDKKEKAKAETPSNPEIYKSEKEKVETLESQKKELDDSMEESDHGTMVQREMMKIRKEGKMKENSVTDTHKIIHEAERRVGNKRKDTEKFTSEQDRAHQNTYENEVEQSK